MPTLERFFDAVSKLPRHWYLQDGHIMGPPVGPIGMQSPVISACKVADVPLNVGIELVDAANNEPWCDASLRSRLLKACGLSES